jgi:hypothetical protein
MYLGTVCKKYLTGAVTEKELPYEISTVPVVIPPNYSLFQGKNKDSFF